MMESQPFASNSGVRSICARCGKTWPVETMSCSACDTEIGGETDLDVHSVETALFDARRASVTASHTDTVPDAEAFPSEPPIKSTQAANELLSFTEHTDDEVSDVTAEVLRKPNVADPIPVGVSSNDPPTQFLKGIDQHIELPSGSVVNDYEIDAKLGAGAMGVVYSARHVRLGRRVALKVIAPSIGADPQALARFEREARALASLQHPNIVDVYAFSTLPDGRSYFVMEFLTGETLNERIERGRMPLDEALDVVDQVARALEAAHAQGIVHRDLKPSNTFLLRLAREQRSVVKLLDFGLVKLAVADDVERTASGAVIGTALYLSPEQARGPNVDGRTDVYALGCVAYEVVLGRHPFPEARTPTAAIAAHLTEPPPQPRTIWPGIPAALDLLLFSMLAKDPNYRPTLAQVRNVVASVRSANAEGAKRATTVSVRRGTFHTRAWNAALVALSLLVGILIGARFLDGRSNRGHARSMGPVGADATSSGSQREVPPRTAQDSRVTSAVSDPVVDAGTAQPRAPAANSIDAGTTSETNPALHKRETRAKSDAAKSQITPTFVERPTHSSVPLSSTTKPPGRNDTINPFAKRGSAIR